jgi:hypothetical protein
MYAGIVVVRRSSPGGSQPLPTASMKSFTRSRTEIRCLTQCTSSRSSEYALRGRPVGDRSTALRAALVSGERSRNRFAFSASRSAISSRKVAAIAGVLAASSASQLSRSRPSRSSAWSR